MGKFIKLLLIILLIGFVPAFLSASPYDTPAGTTITNTVTASYSNALGTTWAATDTITTNVLEIYGLSATLTNTTNAYTAPNTTVNFVGRIQNEGNTSAVVYFTNLLEAYGGGASGWTITFLNDSMNNATSMTLGEDSARYFYLQVQVPVTASFGQSLTNQFAAIFTNSTRFSTLSSYTGWNGTNYGGSAQSESRLAIVIVQAPVITLAKYSYVTNTPDYLSLGGNTYDVVPGSAIIYAITFTNSGNTSAYGLTISDPLSPDVVYVSSSMKYEEGSLAVNLPQDYNNATFSLGDGAADDGVGAYSVEGDPNGGSGPVQFKFANAIPAGGRGTVYFKVYVK